MTTNKTTRLTKCLAVLAASVALTANHSLHAQAWQTVLDYQYPGGTGGGRSIIADSAGNIFAAGNGSDAGGITRGIVLKTDTTQANWFLSDDTNPSPSQYESMVSDLGHDSHGNLYSVGQLWPNSTPGVAYWYVRKSSDGGMSWSTLFEPDGSLYQYTPGQWVYPTGFAADNSGNIYVVGGGRGATVVGSGKNAKVQSTIHWLVRKSSDGGQTWRLVDDMVTGGPYADAAAMVPGVGVFVVGAHFNSQWIVRRSATGEPGTWSTVAGPIENAAAHGVCSDSQGNVYVAGTQFVATGVVKQRGQTVTNGYYAWITRKSSDSGNTWQTVDTFTYAPAKGSDAHGIGRDSAGNVVVVGRASDSEGKYHWIVRTPGPSGVWQTVDDFQLAPGYYATAMRATTDAAGKLLVTGTANDATRAENWIVRRLSPPTL